MKFVLLKSWGGDYMVVASNIAYLRTDENNQTKVGLIGGDSLLVAGTMEEVAATILAGQISGWCCPAQRYLARAWCWLRMSWRAAWCRRRNCRLGS